MCCSTAHRVDGRAMRRACSVMRTSEVIPTATPSSRFYAGRARAFDSCTHCGDDLLCKALCLVHGICTGPEHESIKPEIEGEVRQGLDPMRDRSLQEAARRSI